MRTLQFEIIFETVKRCISGILDDTLPVTAAVVDPAKVQAGITVQRDYPLGLIEREFGVPFARLRSDTDGLVCDSTQLHRSKWPLDVHQAVFQVDADTESWLNGDGSPRRVAFSTGLGNVLQNLRTLAWERGRVHHVEGETPGHPYACLVGYDPSACPGETVGVELLRFNQDGTCSRLDRERFASGGAGRLAGTARERRFQQRLLWAVSGYPLVLGGSPVRLEETAAAVGDFRHLWRLPRLQRSVGNHLSPLSPPALQGKAEFYFAAQALREPDVFVRAVAGLPLTLPVDLAVTSEWAASLSQACGITADLTHCSAYRRDCGCIEVPLGQFRADFEDEGRGYTEQLDDQAELQPGEFRIDEAARAVTVRLLPAYYPQHIVGLHGSGTDLRVVNISIAGLSGRTGITIQAARELCVELGLTDALIFDNGNDVVARIGTSAGMIAHAKNTREARLTAALHFAVPAAGYDEPTAAEGKPLRELHLEGIEVESRDFRVTPERN